MLCAAFAAPAAALTVNIITQNGGGGVPFQLVNAAPFDREQVASPATYVLRFSQPIRPDKSSIRVFDMFGSRVNDDAITTDGMSMTTALPTLAPGKYTVKWQARCRCAGEQELGETFHFTVK